MVAITTAPVPPIRNATARAPGHGCPVRRARRTPARYSNATASTATSTGTSRVHDVTARDTVSGGGTTPATLSVVGGDLGCGVVPVGLRDPPRDLGGLELVLLRPDGLQRADRHQVAQLGGALQRQPPAHRGQ